MSSMSKRVALGVLTLAGLVVAGVGLWFTSHLGPSGSGEFTARPSGERLVVLEPRVLNRVDSPVTITAKAKDGAEVWIGRAAPSDASALVESAARQSVTGVSLGDWALRTSTVGQGTAPALGQADVWRQAVAGKGSATLTVDQQDAPETVVIGTASGEPADLTSLEVTWQSRAWAFEALVLILLGVVLAAAGAAGLWRLRPRAAGAAAGPRHAAPPRDQTVALPARDAGSREDTVALPADRGGREDTVALPADRGGREDTVTLPTDTPTSDKEERA
ncbi:MAG TPA: hypothetical protein VFG97_08815 [Pedococcus sp.]|nr:hypothetical protein [Pedococcus sp.]